MKNDIDKLEEIRHSLSKVKEHLRILETNVPVEKQMEYFHFSENVRRNAAVKPIPVEEQINIINTPDSPEEDKKYYMAVLAQSGNVLAYRALESYASHPNPELKDWADMSLMVARVSLEMELSGEKQIFISTGLGGRGSKLRFFALLKSKHLKPFSSYQKELIEREFPFQIEKNEGFIDELHIEENYVTLLFLIEISINIKGVLDNLIVECNQYGDFMDAGYLLTNVKIYSPKEIQKELEKTAHER
ncbi:MAG: hypothetical protein LBM08_00630 [Dysgonamonadaceae bacterium]|jgi:hypothetical protein|nr:hypothetical protein [Dysgonamonadaceae bacterium]